MTRRERNFLIGGAAVGLLLAAIVVGIFTWPAGSEQARTVETAESQVAPAPEQPAAGGAQHLAHTAMQGAPGSELGSVELSEEEQRSIGLRTAEVRPRDIRREVRAVGVVEEAETQLSTISARVGGRIDDLLVDFTGQSVSRGQPIAQIYSPEVLASAEEYRLALQMLEKLGAQANPQAVEQARELVSSSRRRLELWGLTAKQIEEIAGSGDPKIHITVYSPVSGIVTERKVTEGQYVREGDVLYSVADLSRVWVVARVYENELSQVRVGQRAEITSEALPQRKLRGQVSFIEPVVDPETRTIPVRIQVSNPGLRLRPGMYVNAQLAAGEQKVLAVPRSAVLQTGTRELVYVAKGNGIFEGRAVQVGEPGEDYYPVLAGLRQGERVVSEGAFMVDSQTRITGGMTGLFGGSQEFGGAQESGQRPASEKAQSGRASEESAGPQLAAGKYSVSFEVDPDPPRGGKENQFRVRVKDSEGQPVRDAKVTVTLVMPAMPSMGMPEMRDSFELQWNGQAYVAGESIMMEGPWNVQVEVRRGGAVIATHRARIQAR